MKCEACLYTDDDFTCSICDHLESYDYYGDPVYECYLKKIMHPNAEYEIYDLTKNCEFFKNKCAQRERKEYGKFKRIGWWTPSSHSTRMNGNFYYCDEPTDDNTNLYVCPKCDYFIKRKIWFFGTPYWIAGDN